MQALYAFYQSGNSNLAKGEKELFHSIDRIYDLYIYYLQFFDEINDFARHRIDENKKKRLPSPEDLNPNTRFVDNAIFNLLGNNEALLNATKTRKISWAGEDDLIKKIYREIVASEEYDIYMNMEECTFDDDRQFALKVFKKYIANSVAIHDLFEERSIYWNDDIDLMCSMVIKTIKSLSEDSGAGAPLLPLYKDAEDEIQFVKDLFRRSDLEDDDNEAMIQEKTQNWEVDRIASMDILLMKMGITEVQHFESIPVKVTLNEYIEISKFYSTPKSNVFINGILDKVFDDLKEAGKINKIGRGLIS
jgi:N utilization substance protein B